MYWDIGEYVSRRVADGGWGKSVVKKFSDFIQSRYIGIKGFSASNIHLPDKRILENKLRELSELAESTADEDDE